ncbi:hypothetical protein GCM10020256_11740 [Streptomyces thermocoprophilus]
MLDGACVLHLVEENERKACGDGWDDAWVLGKILLGDGVHVLVAEDAAAGQGSLEVGQLLAAGRLGAEGGSLVEPVTTSSPSL